MLPTQNIKLDTIRLNTITWDNEADFAPEFLLVLGKQQAPQIKSIKVLKY